jgi:hypothetical protein
MFKWYREFLEIRYAQEDRLKRLVVCESCETLKHQLEVANFEKKQLLDKLLGNPVIESSKEPIPLTHPRSIPWNVKRQMLETEDREKARLIREAPTPISTEDLEKDLDIASAEREATVKG